MDVWRKETSVRWRGRKGQCGLHPLALRQPSRSFCLPASLSSTFTSFWRLCPWLRSLLVPFSPLSCAVFLFLSLSLRFTYPILRLSCTSSPPILVSESSPPGRVRHTFPSLRCFDVSWLERHQASLQGWDQRARPRSFHFLTPSSFFISPLHPPTCLPHISPSFPPLIPMLPCCFSLSWL